MKTMINPYERNFLIVTGVFVVAFFVFFMGFRNKSVKLSQGEIQQINYEMAKAKSSGQLYSLDGREIDREMIELENEKLNANSVKKAALTDKIEKDAAKKDAKAKSDAAKKAVAQNQQAKSSDQTQAGRAARSGLAPAGQEKSVSQLKGSEQIHNSQVTAAQNYYAQNQPAQNQTPANEQNPDKKEFKSIEEWRSEILAAGNRETILKFVSAYNKKEFSQAEFYSIVELLVKSDDAAKVGLGLYALRATPSYVSYTTLVSHQTSATAQYQQYIEETLISYNQPAFLGILKQALMSQNKIVILKTIATVKKGIQEIKSGSSSQLVDARHRRDSSVLALSLQQYTSFVPVVNQLTALSQQNGDQEVYIASTQLNQTLQSNSIVAAAY